MCDVRMKGYTGVVVMEAAAGYSCSVKVERPNDFTQGEDEDVLDVMNVQASRVEDVNPFSKDSAIDSLAEEISIEMLSEKDHVLVLADDEELEKALQCQRGCRCTSHPFQQSSVVEEVFA